MATLVSLQGNGAFTVQYQNEAFHLRSGDVDRIVSFMNNDVSRAYHLAARQKDIATAQQLFVEAAALFYSAPAVPIVVVRSQQRQNRKQTTALAI